MAIVNKEGGAISYDSTALINELKMDIIELGADFIFFATVAEISGVAIITNYDIPIDGSTEDISEMSTQLRQGEYLVPVKGVDLLDRLIKQNKLL